MGADSSNPYSTCHATSRCTSLAGRIHKRAAKSLAATSRSTSKCTSPGGPADAARSPPRAPIIIPDRRTSHPDRLTAVRHPIPTTLPTDRVASCPTRIGRPYGRRRLKRADPTTNPTSRQTKTESQRSGPTWFLSVQHCWLFGRDVVQILQAARGRSIQRMLASSANSRIRSTD